MSERPECAVCGYPLGHIDEACPRCLPGFYTPEYRSVSAGIVALKARVVELELALKYARRFLKPEDHDTAYVDKALATTPAKPETRGGE